MKNNYDLIIKGFSGFFLVGAIIWNFVTTTNNSNKNTEIIMVEISNLKKEVDHIKNDLASLKIEEDIRIGLSSIGILNDMVKAYEKFKDGSPDMKTQDFIKLTELCEYIEFHDFNKKYPQDYKKYSVDKICTYTYLNQGDLK